MKLCDENEEIDLSLELKCSVYKKKSRAEFARDSVPSFPCWVLVVVCVLLISNAALFRVTMEMQ